MRNLRYGWFLKPEKGAVAINLLIVDDDKLFVMKTIEGIDWKSIGIHRVFSAENIKQALDVLNTFSIDIIATDVEMPMGSGLELLEWLSEHRYPAETLVISGYAHFAYAQKAIEYGSRRYLLKPLSCKEFSLVVAEIVQERISRNGSPGLMQSGQDVLHAPSTEAFIAGVGEKPSAAQEGIRFFLIKLVLSLAEETDETKSRLRVHIVQSVILEMFEKSAFTPENICVESSRTWSLVVSGPEESAALGEIFGKIQNYLEETAHLSCCVYISAPAVVGALKERYPQFTDFCEQCLYIEHAIIRQDEWQKAAEAAVVPLDAGALTECLQAGIFDSALCQINAYVDELVRQKQATQLRICALTDELLRIARSILENYGIDAAETGIDGLFLDTPVSLTSLKKSIQCLMEKLKEATNTETKRKKLVAVIRQYIDEHLDEALNRKSLANQFFFSEDYLARVFKQETGENISDYIIERRIRRAERYLRETELPIGTVAIRVGYNNFSYFSKKFKELTGKSPNEYRYANRNSGK